MRSVQYALGTCYSELNAILRKIKHQRWGEPTEKQRQRIAALQQEIRDLKSGKEW